jgi:hypothetical protein
MTATSSRPIVAPHITAWSGEQDQPYRLVVIPGVGMPTSPQATVTATASSGTAPRTVPARGIPTLAVSTLTGSAAPCCACSARSAVAPPTRPPTVCSGFSKTTAKTGLAGPTPWASPNHPSAAPASRSPWLVAPPSAKALPSSVPATPPSPVSTAPSTSDPTSPPSMTSTSPSTTPTSPGYAPTASSANSTTAPSSHPPTTPTRSDNLRNRGRSFRSISESIPAQKGAV